jgi:hypothetical protein
MKEFPSETLNKGINTLNFNLTNKLIPGIYYLEALTEKGFLREKVVVIE